MIIPLTFFFPLAQDCLRYKCLLKLLLNQHQTYSQTNTPSLEVNIATKDTAESEIPSLQITLTLHRVPTCFNDFISVVLISNMYCVLSTDGHLSLST